MNSRQVLKGCLVAALVTLGTHFDSHRAVAAPQDQNSSDEGVQVLTRGPIHAAFAETVTYDPQPGIVVAKAPPEPIEELPPNQRPEGDNVAWIPGYWAWDDDRDDYLWVSGTWRALPPGRQWVPGYWGKVSEGYQWTSGYWADAKVNEVQYLPEPPATIEDGPNSAAPSANHIWAPGSWMWNQNRYAWRPGYWMPAQQNWMWIPARYQWSPRGYVFVDGYYDYSVARRGVLFAPVYFNPSVYAQSGFTYSPAMAISMAVFGNQLFLRPSYNHYYFGDYYGSNYSSGGYYPWFSYNTGRNGYDPFYAQQFWQNRQNTAWATTVQSDYQNRVDNESARPLRTLAAQQALVKSGDASSKNNLVAATSLDDLAKSKDSSLRLQPVTKAEQQTLAKQGQEVHQFGAARQKLEAKSATTSAETPAKGSEPVTAKLSKSPIVAKGSDQLGKDHAPPMAHEAPKPDHKVEPKPRVAGGKPSREGLVPTSKVEPKETPKVAPKLTPKTDPADAPKAEPKPLPKGEKPLSTSEKPSPKVENPLPKTEKPLPKVEPKTEPKPAPKVEPKPAPKVEPNPAPKVEPKPVPKVEPTPAPKVEPKPEAPKAEPKDKPKK